MLRTFRFSQNNDFFKWDISGLFIFSLVEFISLFFSLTMCVTLSTFSTLIVSLWSLTVNKVFYSKIKVKYRTGNPFSSKLDGVKQWSSARITFLEMLKKWHIYSKTLMEDILFKTLLPHLTFISSSIKLKIIKSLC